MHSFGHLVPWVPWVVENMRIHGVFCVLSESLCLILVPKEHNPALHWVTDTEFSVPQSQTHCRVSWQILGRASRKRGLTKSAFQNTCVENGRGNREGVVVLFTQTEHSAGRIRFGQRSDVHEHQKPCSRSFGIRHKGPLVSPKTSTNEIDLLWFSRSEYSRASLFLVVRNASLDTRVFSFSLKASLVAKTDCTLSNFVSCLFCSSSNFVIVQQT